MIVAAARTPRCSPPASGSAPPGRCCCPAAGPTGARRCGSSARRPPTCWPSRRSYPTFPILLETTRECLNDVFDLPALREVLADLRGRDGPRRRRSTRPQASPFAQSLLFGWIAVYMYEGDAPLAERRAAALGARPRPAARPARRRGAARAARPRRARRPRARAAAPRRRPPGPRRRRAARPAAPARPADARPSSTPGRTGDPRGRWLDQPGRRAAGHRGRRSPASTRFAAAEDAARLRDALGVALPGRAAGRVHRPGRRAAASTSSPASPAPTARSSPPRSPRRLGVGVDAVRAGARGPRGRRAGSCGASSGPTASSASGATTTCLRQLRRRSLAALRQEVEPVDGSALARFLPAWHGVGSKRRGLDALVEVLGHAAGRGAPGVGARGRHPAAPGWPSTAPPTSTRCARPARSCGSAPARLGVGRRPGPARVPRPGAGARARRRPRSSRRPTARRRCSTTSQPRGASFWPELVQAVADAGLPLRRRRGARRAVGSGVGRPGHQRLAGAAPGAGRAASRRGERATSPRGGPVRGRLARLGPARGRRALVARRAAARARAVADRGGPRPGAAAARALRRAHPRGGAGEGIEGGFAGVYPVLKALEERGQVRRGYFVAGLGAAQFACPARSTACARSAIRARRRECHSCRACRHRPGPALRRRAAVARARAGRPARTAGAHVVLVDGELAALPRAGRAQPGHVPAVDARLGRRRLVQLVDTRPLPRSRSARSTACRCATTPSCRRRRAAGRRLRRRLQGLVYRERR